MSKKLTVTAITLLTLVAVGMSQTMPAYVRARWVDQYLPYSLSAVGTLVSNSQFNCRGKMLPTAVVDSVKCGQAQALSCTLDFEAPIVYPFVWASASTVTTALQLMQDYGDNAPRGFVTVAGDSFFWYGPCAVKRLVFTVAAADTPCAFYAYGYAANLK